MGTGDTLVKLRRWGVRALHSVWEWLRELVGRSPNPEHHTAVTFRAVADSVLPETPRLGDELGDEHVPGALAIGLDEFHAEYVDEGFQFGLPHVGFVGNASLAHPVAHVLDDAANALVEQGGNEDQPSSDRAVALGESTELSPATIRQAAGTFAALSRRDRLRAIARLDEFELDLSLSDTDQFEFDAGLVGQLVVGFAEMIYYSEWQGYDVFDQPPSDRAFTTDPTSIQGWRQTGYPGVANGYAALRGYLGTPDGSLGEADTWTRIDEAETSSVQIMEASGTFAENSYDTSGHEDPYPE